MTDRSPSLIGLFIAALFGLFVAVWLMPAPSTFWSIETWLPIHMIMEIFSIIVAMQIFSVVWNTYDPKQPRAVLLLGCIMGAVGVLDLGHTLSFKGMPDFVTPSGPEKAIYFWLSARLLAALALLIAAMSPMNALSSTRWRCSFISIVIAAAGLVFWVVLAHQDILPRAFIDGEGLTKPKIAAEYTVIGILILSGLCFIRKYHANSLGSIVDLIAASAVSVLGELCFTVYGDVSDAFNVLGHVYKVIAYYFIYRAVVVATLRAPFQGLLQKATELRDSEERFSTIFRSSPIGIGIGKLNGELLDVNQAWLDLVGYTREQALGRTTEELGIYERPEHRLRIIEILKNCAKVTALEMPYRRYNGEHIDVEYSAEIITISGDPALLVMILDITQRKAEAIALRRFETIVETLGDPVAFISQDERYVTANPAYQALLGKGADELVGQRLIDGMGEELYKATNSHIQAALAGTPQRYSLERLYPDGRRHAFDVSLTPFVLDGKVRGIVANLHDITELQRTRDVLEAAQKMAGLGSWKYDFSTGIYTPSVFMGKLIGRNDRPLNKEDVTDLIHPEDLDHRNEAWQAALAGAPLDLEYRMIVAGKILWIHIKAQIEFNSDGAPVSAIGISQDVTTAREAELALKTYRDHLEELVTARTIDLETAEAKTRLILETTANGMYGIDTEGRITFINPSACKMLGYDPAEVIGRNSHAIFHRQDQCTEEECPISVAVRSGKSEHCEDDQFWRADGTPLPVSYAAAPMIQNGDIVGAVISLTDIRQQKQITEARELALAEAERLALVRREFLANMSHEIRTPLNGVLGLAQLGRQESTGRRAANTFAGILDAGQSLLGVVDDILDFSKIEAGKFALDHQPLSLGNVIDQAVGLVAMRAYAKGLQFRIDEALDLPTICLGDAKRLSQILGNLLSNSVKFTKAGEMVLAASRDGHHLMFRLSDTGIGMTPDQVARLFRPFEQADSSTTRNFGGTGLGLAISKDLLEMMGGTIVAESSLFTGSIFTVRIPLEIVEGPRSPVWPGSVVVVGLPDADATPLRAGLSRVGVPVASLMPGDDMPAATEMFVILASLITEPGGKALMDAALAQGSSVVLVATPGRFDIPANLPDKVRVVERPLRLRHLVTAPGSAISVAHPPLAAREHRLAGVRILGAEDNDLNRLVLEELLSMEGAILDCVENGRAAMERLEKLGANAYDIVITDVQMPEMDGYELARRIAIRDPGLAVIGLTAHAMKEERERCIAAGMVEHVAKPINVEHLVPIIQRHRRKVPAGTAAPLLDLRRLEARYGARPDFIAKLLATIRSSHATSAAELESACRDNDYPRLAMLAHSIKGAAGNMAAPVLQELAQRTEIAARQSQCDAKESATQLASAIKTLLAEIAEGSE